MTKDHPTPGRALDWALGPGVLVNAIGIIGVLEIKTRGNLSDTEDKLLKSLLYDLRVRYCDAHKREAQKG